MNAPQQRNSREPRFFAGLWLGLMAGLCLLGTFSAALAQDSVLIRSDHSKNGSVEIHGKILRWTRKGLELQEDGRKDTRKFASADVLGFRCSQSKDEQSAEQEFRQGRYQEALELYRHEFIQVNEAWKQNRILEKIVRCYTALGQNAQAMEFFLDLADREPEMPDEQFASAPLAWRSNLADTAAENKARQILKQNRSPVAQMLCASWLLGSKQRNEMIQTLQGLCSNKDARIASLATALLWRTELTALTPQKIDQWQTELQAIPQPLRGGAYFVLGQGLEKLERYDDAAMAYLKCALAYTDDPQLAADARRLAAAALEKAGHPEEKAALLK